MLGTTIWVTKGDILATLPNLYRVRPAKPKSSSSIERNNPQPLCLGFRV